MSDAVIAAIIACAGVTVTATATIVVALINRSAKKKEAKGKNKSEEDKKSTDIAAKEPPARKKKNLSFSFNLQFAITIGVVCFVIAGSFAVLGRPRTAGTGTAPPYIESITPIKQSGVTLLPAWESTDKALNGINYQRGVMFDLSSGTGSVIYQLEGKYARLKGTLVLAGETVAPGTEIKVTIFADERLLKSYTINIRNNQRDFDLSIVHCQQLKITMVTNHNTSLGLVNCYFSGK